MVEVLEDLASKSATDDIVARLVHPQSDAVEQYHSHTEALKPSEEGLRKIALFVCVKQTYMYIHIQWSRWEADLNF